MEAGINMEGGILAKSVEAGINVEGGKILKKRINVDPRLSERRKYRYLSTGFLYL